MAKTVEMTKMPELVAFMHSMIGLAAVAFIAVAAVVEPSAFGIAPAGGAHPGRQPGGTGAGRLHRGHHLHRLGHRLGQALGTSKFRLFQGAPVVFKASMR